MPVPLILPRFATLGVYRREIAGYPAQRLILVDNRPKGRLHWTAKPGDQRQPTNPFWKD